MCGIAGIIGENQTDHSRIISSLYHRGPDAQNIFHDSKIKLIHTRLAVQDIKNGQQPLSIGNFVIVFNGEIYNHIELRKKVKSYTFKSMSDTETFLALFIELGEDFLELVDGMFAFAIYDKINQKIFLGRDRVGKKPLYYFKHNKSFFFASELNTILQAIPSIEINKDSIFNYLRAGFIETGSTPYQYTYEVLPGTICELDIGSLYIKSRDFFSIEKFFLQPKSSLSQIETLEKIDYLLTKSIKNRLISSDVEVGVFLSGGIDSSLITAIAGQHNRNLKTFTVKFSGKYDESKLARKVAEKYSTNHHELNINMDLTNDIETILSSYGEPFMDSSAIPSHYISKEARKFVKVVLNGDGADEIFGGYRRHIISRYSLFENLSYFSFIKNFLPNPKSKFSYLNYVSRLINISSKKNLDRYLSTTTDIFEDFFQFHNSTFAALEEKVNYFQSLNISGLSNAKLNDIEFLLKNDLLKKMDIATMQYSLEARSPFLSKYLLEFVPTIPDNLSIRNFQTKWALRKIADKYGLSFLSSQPKRGFEIPLSKLVNVDLKENINDVLLGRTYSEDFIDRESIDKIINKNNKATSEKNSKMLWTLYALEIFYKNFNVHKVDKKSRLSHVDTNYKKKKILSLLTGLGLGGAEKVVLQICNHSNAHEFEHHLISISSQNYLAKEFKKYSSFITVLDKKKNIFDILNSILYIYKYIKLNKIQLIHAHMFHTLIISTFLKIFHPKIKIIFTAHNSFYNMKARKFIVWLLRPFRSFDTIFSSESLSYFHSKNFSVIPNGVNTKIFRPSEEKKGDGKFKFIMVGRLERMKNHDFIIDIFDNLRHLDITLDIFGTGELETYLKNKVKDLNLNEKINFKGPNPKIYEVINSYDCLLLPSLWESLPLVLFEAGSAGVPVIATPVGSIPSVLNQNNSYIVELSDFKAAILDLISKQDVAKKKSKSLRDLILKDYEITKIVKKYESLYRSFFKL